MKKLLVTLILSVLFCSLAGAQARAGRLSPPESMETLKVEFSSVTDLLSDGWEQVEPETWHKTMENGVEAEIALGAAAWERTRAWLDADIEALRAMESLDDEQELMLFDLLLRREKLDQVEVSTKATDSEELCGGTASFVHNFGWYNFAYAFAESQATWRRWFSLGQSAVTYVRAGICSGSLCTGGSDLDRGTGFVVSSNAYASQPTWSCTAGAYGSVSISGSLPSGCQTIASYSTSWNCGDPIP